MISSYPSDQSKIIEQSQIELITNLQRSGQLNEILAVLQKLEEIVNDGKKNSWRNLFLHYTPDLMLEDIKEQIAKSPHTIRSLIRQMLFYREKRIERSISAFRYLRNSVLTLIPTVFTTSITQSLVHLIFGLNWNWLWLFSLPVLFYCILCILFYIGCYFSTDIRFVKSFQDLVKTLEKASKDLLDHMSNSLTNILQYSEELTKIKTEALLNEEQQRSLLSVRDNLLFLASKVAEKEFELKARYIVRDTGLQKDLGEIQKRIKNIKDKPEVKSIREEFYSKGVIREYEMALESIRSVIQEATEVVKHNAKESKKMHKLLKPLTRMATRFESRGEAAWSQTDLGSVTEVLGKIAEIFANQPKIEINIEDNIVNNSEQTSYTQNVDKPNNTGVAQGPNSTGIRTQIINQTTSEIQELTKTLRQQIKDLATETSELAIVHLDVIDAEIVSSEQNPSAKVKAALKGLWDLIKEITPVARQVLEIAGKLGLATLIG